MANPKCKGKGDCLVISGPYTYTRGDTPCVHECRAVMCPNALFCGRKYVPQWMLDCNDGRCVECNVAFGNVDLIIREKMECLKCFTENTRVFQYPGCRHHLCIDCFDNRVRARKCICKKDLPIPHWQKRKRQKRTTTDVVA